MLKARIILTGAGAAIAAVGAAGGFLLPVGVSCTGALSLQKVSMSDPDSRHAMAAWTTCKAAAQQAAPLWSAVIAVGITMFVTGLIWSLIVWLKRPAAGRQKQQADAPGHRSPSWPLLLGLAVIAAGIFLGYAVSVGPHCDGAFAAHQTSAAGADIASAMNGTRSDYGAECRAAAGQQSIIYWGIIGFGAAVFILGLVLKSVQGRRPEQTQSSVAGELEQLAALLERGVLTREEFAREKEKLLARG